MNLLLVVAIATTAPLDTATFAGGCFWSMERAFDQVDGVVSVTVGYTGGHTPRPSYEQVSTGQTGHLESVQVVYDPRKIGYERLVDAFWHDIDPTQADGQFCDHGARHEAERRRAAAVADPGAVPSDPARANGAAVPQRVLRQPPRRHLRGRRLGRTAVQLARQVRVGHRVAELHEAARGRERPPEDRPVALHGADRGSVGPCRFAPGAPVRRWPGADGVALLHQLRRVALHSGRAPAGRRLRAVLAAVPDHAALIPVQRFGAPARWAGRRCRMAPRWYAVCVMAPIATPSASSS